MSVVKHDYHGNYARLSGTPKWHLQKFFHWTSVQCATIVQTSIFLKKPGKFLLNFTATVNETLLGWDWWYKSIDICHPT